MDWGAIILTLVLDLILTVFFYLLVPVILCIRKKPMTQKQIKKVVIINGICVCILFVFIRLANGGDLKMTPAVFLWSWVAKKIMEKRLLVDDATGVLNEAEHVDETHTTTEQSVSDSNIPQTIEPKMSVEDTQSVDINNEMLFCRKCGNKLTEDSLYCYKCGANVLVPDKTLSKETKGKLSNKKLTVPILFSVSAIILIAIVALGIPEFKYQLACSKLENGFYEEAIELFEDLDGYKKSYAKIQEAKDEQFKQDNNLNDYIECTIAELYFNPKKYNGKKVAVSSWKVACKYMSGTVAGTYYDFLLCDNLTYYEDKSNWPISPIYKYYVDCIEPYGVPYIGALAFSDVIYAEIPVEFSAIKIYGTFTYNSSRTEGGRYAGDPHVYNVDVDCYTFE